MTDRQFGVPTLIIVSGLPGSGKSTLAQRLAAHFALPLIQKDMIKETLCDVLQCTTLSQSQLYGHASMVLLYRFAEVILKRGQPCIIESTFHPTLSTRDLLKLRQQCSFFPLQIHCQAERSILAERVKQRWESGKRHHGHMEHLRESDPDLLPQEYLQPLSLNSFIIELDTTDFATIDYKFLFDQIQHVLNT